MNRIHQLRPGELKKDNNMIDPLIVKVTHQCKLCNSVVLQDGSYLQPHMQTQHQMKLRDYYDSYVIGDGQTDEELTQENVHAMGKRIQLLVPDLPTHLCKYHISYLPEAWCQVQ